MSCNCTISDKLYTINRFVRVFDKPSKCWTYMDSKPHIVFCEKCSTSLDNASLSKITSIISSCKNEDGSIVTKSKDFKNPKCDCCDRCAKKVNTPNTYSAVYSHDVIDCEPFETQDSAEFLYLCFKCEEIKRVVLYQQKEAIIKLKNGFELDVAIIDQKYWQ